jgi:multidrug efflux pump subunit AcrB
MIRFFSEHPTAANLLMIILACMGLFTISSLRRQTFPEFIPAEVEIRIIYPGATAEKVEETICRRVEDAIDGVNYVEEIRAEAREGMARIVVEMKENENFQMFLDDIQTEVNAIDDFPDEIETPVVKALGQTDPVVTLAVSGPMSLPDLKAYCEYLKDQMQMEKSISLVQIDGFSDQQIQIQLESQALIQLGLSVHEISDIISRQSIDFPSGSLETNDQDILIRFSDERRDPIAFENLVVISGKTGAEIRLGDIATITETFELNEAKIMINGVPGAFLRIQKNKTEDALRVLDAVKSFITKESLRKPENVTFTLTQDYASVVRDRLILLSNNGWQGFVLVFLSLWLFFSYRFSFWVVMGLPVSFLGAFFFLPMINYSINMFTMVGMLIALGLLMDDAIVIAENIASHLSKGKSALQAAIDGTSEVKTGVLSSFFTTLCIFGPISFMNGAIGRVLKVLPVMLILILTVSLIEAFLILPHHLAHSLKHHHPDKSNWFRDNFNLFFDWLRDLFGTFIDWAVNWRYLCVGLSVALFILSVGMLKSGILKFQAFPDIEGNVAVARILLPQGTPLTKTEQVVDRITKALYQVNAHFKPMQPDQQDLVKNIMTCYNLNEEASENGPHVATIMVDLLNAEKRNAGLDDFFHRWRQGVGNIPDVLHLSFTEPVITPAGRAIDIRLHGQDLWQLKQAAVDLYQWLSRFRGILDLCDDLRPGKHEIKMRLRDGALSMGLTSQMVAAQLKAAYYGRTADKIQVEQTSYEIDVRMTASDQNSLADLDDFYITLPNGKQTPLTEVVHIQNDRGFARILRINGQRTVSLKADVDTRQANTAEIIAQLNAVFLPDFQKKYPNIRISFSGEIKEAATTKSSLARGFMIGLIGIFVLLSFQFRTYSEPFVVMVAIPFAFIGVVWGHLTMGIEVCMPSMVGFVSLAGIVVNDSILLVQFLKTRREQGYSTLESAAMAGRERFRAVMLTSITTIAGLIPLLFEKSLQAQFLIPLAVSIVFGILASTVFVLVMVPVVYSIFGDFNWIENVKGHDPS